MNMEEDDSMEIDETIPATPIIERSSDEISPNNSLTEAKAVVNTDNEDAAISESTIVPNIEEIEKTPLKELETISNIDANEKQAKSVEKQVDVVILDDDDDDEDEPIKTVEGTYY